MSNGEESVVGTLVVRGSKIRIDHVKAAMSGPSRLRRLSFFVPPGNVQVGDEVELLISGGLCIIPAEVVAHIPAGPNDDGEHFDAEIHGGARQF